jgi:hypothetical protein
MSDYEFEAEALREGEQVARDRHQAQVEMEQTLIRQEQELERGTGVPIVEQADGSDNFHEDGEGVITATHDGGGSGDSMGGSSIGSPGAGTDPSETQTSSDYRGGEQDSRPERNIELEGGERTFEGEGRHSLSDQ